MGRWCFQLPLIGRASHLITQRILPRGERVWVQIAGGPARGLWIKLDPYRESGYLQGCLEPGVQEQLVKYLEPGDIFYDVGAHIGFYSLLGIRLVGMAGTVVAFEPDPDNAKVLQENLIKNGLSQVKVIRAAVWNRDGKVSFQKCGGDTPQSSSRRGKVISLNSQENPSDLLEVEAITLDQFVKNNRAPGVMKIDVEGAESEVLKGARRLLKDARPVLVCEVHGAQGANFMEEELGRMGYRLEWLPQDRRYTQYPYPRHVVARPADKNRACKR